MIDCSGRLSELGGVINLVDLRRWNLSRSERHLSVAKMIARSTIDMPKQKSGVWDKV